MKAIWLLLVGVSILALASTTGVIYADGGDESLIHACLDNKGNPRIVGPNDLCKGKETPRHWPEGPAAPSLVVLDANDNVVGNFISIDSLTGPAFIALEVGGNLVTLSVEKNSIFGRQLLYEDTNCQTTPFFSVGGSDLLPPAGVGPPNNTAYLADLSAPVQFINPLSSYDARKSQCGGVSGGQTVEAFPLLPLLKLDDFFTGPFRVEKSNN